MLNTVGLNVGTFIIPYAQEKLGVTDEQVAWLSVIYLAATAAFGTLMGKLADKAGYRSVGAVQSVLLIGFYITAIAARNFPAICAAYVLYSVVNVSGSFMLVNMSVELCPSLDVSDLTALGGVFLLPFVALATPLAGRVIDATDSYPPIFSIGITVAIIALLGFAFLVREPRTGRVYAFKQIDAR
jgi:MFS family permease